MADSSKSLTVKDLLKAPDFQHATVLTGKGGLDKVVTWVHILEITHCQDYLNGQELILTTGVGWKDKDDPHIFLRHLISNNVSALCLQLGKKFFDYSTINDIPEKLIEEAEANDFPIIVFPEQYDCRYVDLMHSLHSMIINKNYKIFLEQEKFLNELYSLLVQPHDIDDLLQILHQTLKVNVAYIPNGGKEIFAPNIEKTEKRIILGCLNKTAYNTVMVVNKGKISLAYRHINAFKQDLGCLVIYSSDKKLDSFEFMVLEKCSIVFAQEFIGNLFVQEKERHNREKWVSRWLTGQINNQEIDQQLHAVEPFLNPTGVTACLVNYMSPGKNQNYIDESILNITGITRSFFEQQGFFMLWKKDFKKLVYILVDTRNSETWKYRLTKALEQVTDLFATSNLNIRKKSISFFIGKKYKNLQNLRKSLKDAEETYYVGEKIGYLKINYYDDLHIYRIIMMLEKNDGIEQYINDYLRPIYKDDGKPDKTLLDTLIALRDCQYNKKEASEKLYIARQSLYQRIKTLEELLGDDTFSSPEKRICIEIALYGLDYLYNNQDKYEYKKTPAVKKDKPPVKTSNLI